jgi:hypothetical protein
VKTPQVRASLRCVHSLPALLAFYQLPVLEWCTTHVKWRLQLLWRQHNPNRWLLLLSHCCHLQCSIARAARFGRGLSGCARRCGAVALTCSIESTACRFCVSFCHQLNLCTVGEGLWARLWPVRETSTEPRPPTALPLRQGGAPRSLSRDCATMRSWLGSADFNICCRCLQYTKSDCTTLEKGKSDHARGPIRNFCSRGPGSGS